MGQDISFSRCARILLMLDAGRYNRMQIATKLGVSVPTIARYLAFFRDELGMTIDFRVNPKGRRGAARGPGRPGVLYVTGYGRINRDKALRLCRGFLKMFPDEIEPDNADLFAFLCADLSKSASRAAPTNS
jgi:hypothetical protein